MDAYKQGDHVRHIEELEAVDLAFEGPQRRQGKKVGVVTRVYEEHGDEVCDLEYSDGTAETGVAVSDIEPAHSNIT